MEFIGMGIGIFLILISIGFLLQKLAYCLGKHIQKRKDKQALPEMQSKGSIISPEHFIILCWIVSRSVKEEGLEQTLDNIHDIARKVKVHGTFIPLEQFWIGLQEMIKDKELRIDITQQNNVK